MHFAGHVSDAELIAYYELADLFLCASEHEGFCVPLVEAFYKQVPVLAYAATAVPATMDGAGVLFETKDPAHVAALMDADAVESGAPGTPSSTASSRRSTGCRPRISTARCCGFVEQILASPRRGSPHVAFDFWQQFDAPKQLEEVRLLPPGGVPSALPEAAGVIVNQWVPAAHKGDAIGDSARRDADDAARAGPCIRDLRADDRRCAAGRRAAVRRSGGAPRRCHDLPLRVAVADDRGLRRACRAGASCSITT